MLFCIQPPVTVGTQLDALAQVPTQEFIAVGAAPMGKAVGHEGEKEDDPDDGEEKAGRRRAGRQQRPQQKGHRHGAQQSQHDLTRLFEFHGFRFLYCRV